MPDEVPKRGVTHGLSPMSGSVATPRTFGTHEAAEVLADAFAEYPLLDWALGPSESGPIMRYQLFRFLLKRLALPFGAIFRTEFNEGIAVWMRLRELPFVDDKTCAELTRELRDLLGVRCAKGLLEIDDAMKQHHFKRPHLYLYLLGVRRGFQGLGYGTRLLSAGLESANEAQLPVFLETSSERAVRFYSRFNFQVTAEYSVSAGSPKTWTMLRMP